MYKNLTLAVLLLASLSRGALPTMSLPLDWTSAAGISRANLNLNPIALQNAHNQVVDSLNPLLLAFAGYSTSLAMASNQDLILKVDADANGTHRLVVTSNNVDTMFRMTEAGAGKLFGSLTLTDSLIGVAQRLSGSLNVAGAVTLSNYTSGRVPYFTTGGLITTASGFTYDGTALSAPNITAISELAATAVLASESVRADTIIPAVSLKFSGSGSAADWSLWRSSTAGLSIRGGAGSSYDFALFNPAAQYLMRNPTGTQGLEFPGSGTYAFAGPMTAASTMGALRLNVNSATDNANAGVNVKDAQIAVSGTQAIIRSYGLGAPGSANYEGCYMQHDGTKSIFASTASGTGTYRTLALQNPAGTDGLTISNSQAVAIPGTLGVTGVATFTAPPVFSSATASQALEVDGSKGLVSVAKTGSGNDVYSVSPTISGTLTASGPVNLNGGNLSVQRSNSGSTVQAKVSNQSNTASSDAPLILEVAGSSGGDPYIDLSVSGVSDWLVGLDNSNADAFVISEGNSLGANNRIKIAAGGAVSIPGTLNVTGSVTADTLISSKFYEEGSFTATLTGVTTSVTGTARYVRVGKSVTLYLPPLVGVSNSTSCTITGMPAAIASSRQQSFPVPAITDNSTSYSGFLIWNGTGPIQFVRWTSSTTLVAFTFTNSGNKGLQYDATLSYTLQ